MTQKQPIKLAPRFAIDLEGDEVTTSLVVFRTSATPYTTIVHKDGNESFYVVVDKRRIPISLALIHEPRKFVPPSPPQDVEALQEELLWSLFNFASHLVEQARSNRKSAKDTIQRFEPEITLWERSSSLALA